jgi:hypothetical protein
MTRGLLTVGRLPLCMFSYARSHHYTESAYNLLPQLYVLLVLPFNLLLPLIQISCCRFTTLGNILPKSGTINLDQME